MFELAIEFTRIFTGNETAHGEFIITDTSGIKAKGKAKTVPGEVNVDNWIEHLSGGNGLGIIPINTNNQCTWGAIDIDEYELNLEELSTQLPENLLLCRTKSGGAHIYLFTSAPVPAQLIRKKLTLVARALGRPNTEIFPKQDKLEDGQVGNWINMPYFNSESTLRYCIKNGLELSAQDFINEVSENAMSIQQLVAFQPDIKIENEELDIEFIDAPPCLQALIKSGFPSGSRNNALFSMGVYARKKFATGWEDKIFDYNQRFMGPGTYSEVAGIIRSLKRKGYQYKCKDQPLGSVCDRETCQNCTYGVQLSNSEEKGKRPNILDDVTEVICYAPIKGSKDEPYWVFIIGDIELEVTVDMARSQTVFAREYLRQYHKVILPIKDNKWATSINELLASAEIQELAPDAGPEGQLWLYLEEFCTNKAKARAREELLLGKPWTDDGRVYFRSGDLIRFLKQQRFNELKENEIWAIFKRRGAKHHHFQLKGKHVACWSIDAFPEQTDDFDTEDMFYDTVY